MPQLQSQERMVEGVPAIALSGRLDIDTAPDLRNILMGYVRRKASRLVLDMTGLEFMDSSGLATLIEAQLALREHGGRLGLFGVAPQITEVFAMAQVTGMFTIAQSEKAAIEAIGAMAASGGGDES